MLIDDSIKETMEMKLECMKRPISFQIDQFDNAFISVNDLNHIGGHSNLENFMKKVNYIGAISLEKYTNNSENDYFKINYEKNLYVYTPKEYHIEKEPKVIINWSKDTMACANLKVFVHVKVNKIDYFKFIRNPKLLIDLLIQHNVIFN
ncbi:hypothetical protein ACFQZE_07215 [Paenibacillus sp. GCM10027627]|uniref:hypothetical protein n=1 Tax=unclassified Paenibacillus TaxID=185978 RepID=UPI00362950F8